MKRNAVPPIPLSFLVLLYGSKNVDLKEYDLFDLVGKAEQEEDTEKICKEIQAKAYYSDDLCFLERASQSLADIPKKRGAAKAVLSRMVEVLNYQATHGVTRERQTCLHDWKKKVLKIHFKLLSSSKRSGERKSLFEDVMKIAGEDWYLLEDVCEVAIKCYSIKVSRVLRKMRELLRLGVYSDWIPRFFRMADLFELAQRGRGKGSKITRVLLKDIEDEMDILAQESSPDFERMNERVWCFIIRESKKKDVVQKAFEGLIKVNPVRGLILALESNHCNSVITLATTAIRSLNLGTLSMRYYHLGSQEIENSIKRVVKVALIEGMLAVCKREGNKPVHLPQPFEKETTTAGIVFGKVWASLASEDLPEAKRAAFELGKVVYGDQLFCR